MDPKILNHYEPGKRAPSVFLGRSVRLRKPRRVWPRVLAGTAASLALLYAAIIIIPPLFHGA